MPEMDPQSPKPTSSERGDGLPAIAPDIAEQELGLKIDNIVPSYGFDLLPMVGLGGSAGAIPALESFFRAMPESSGMAFVVILHLSPDHSSRMVEMIQKWTPMKVVQAENGAKAEANTVYVIPPGKHLTATNGHLTLSELDRERGRRVAVDLFFRSLADTHGPHAVAIVLSGADSDGTLGIKRIKERGGLVIAQDPDESEHSSMPKSAIGTGMVDWVLPPAQMPRQILEYIANGKELQLPAEDGPQPAKSDQAAASQPEAALRQILVFLRSRTGRDFSYYKRATILRRIARRMQVNRVKDMLSYLAFLRTHPGEAGALLKDLLISVTNFFRDRDAFAALEIWIPELFKGKGEDDPVRVWVPGCATGEEAYSIAILLIEYARTLESPPTIQVFGCDLDEEAVQSARAGVFPETIAADLTESRLQQFFVKEHRGYRVRREVREIVLFAHHDLLKDAPFSRLDLISCRNLLIYLDREAQARVFEIFHFALKTNGKLFLGSSETIDDGSLYFTILNKKHRVFTRKTTARATLPIPPQPGSFLAHQIDVKNENERAESQSSSVLPAPSRFSHSDITSAVRSHRRTRPEERLPWSELHYKLIEKFGPPSILVDADHNIQHLSDSAGRFLTLTGGEPTNNLMSLINPALRLELRAILFRAAQSGEPAEALYVPLVLEGNSRRVNLRVAPAKDLGVDHLLVSFELQEGSPETTEVSVPPRIEPALHQLELELRQLKGQLRDTIEQYEASTEELKASNEELHAMNEELRSATEELETSREELQSINEELTTVNHELKNKVDELGLANSDLLNLMSATEIATVFLDRDMRIMRFTSSAIPIFNLIPNDIGRPLSNLHHRILYPEMAADAANVLRTLVPIEREVSGAEGTCYLARMLPYRTVEDRIAGVVLTFVDITERQRAERALARDLEDTRHLREVSERLTTEGDMRDLFDAIIGAALSLTRSDAGTVQLWDLSNQKLHLLASKGLPNELVEQFASVGTNSLGSCGLALASAKREMIDLDVPGTADPDEFKRRHLEAGFRSAQSTPLIARSGRLIGMLSTFWHTHHRPQDRELGYLDLLARQAADAIERKQAAEALQSQMQELTRFNRLAIGRETRMVELKKENNELASRLGESPRYSLDFEREVGDS